MMTKFYAIVLAAMLVSTPAWAHSDEHAEHHEVAAPATGGELKTLEDGLAALQAAVKEKEFDKIHEVVETMEPALQSIGETHKNDAGIIGTTTQLGKVLTALHTSGDAKDADATTSELRKLDSGLQLLNVRLESAAEAK